MDVFKKFLRVMFKLVFLPFLLFVMIMFGVVYFIYGDCEGECVAQGYTMDDCEDMCW